MVTGGFPLHYLFRGNGDRHSSDYPPHAKTGGDYGSWPSSWNLSELVTYRTQLESIRLALEYRVGLCRSRIYCPLERITFGDRKVMSSIDCASGHLPTDFADWLVCRVKRRLYDSPSLFIRRAAL